jgi:hypothetical protein
MYRCLFFADDSKNLHDIRNVEEPKLLQTDIHSLKKWCLFNDNKLTVRQTTCTNFLLKQAVTPLYINLGFTHTAHSQCVRDLGVILDSTVHFHNHVDHKVLSPLKC